MTVKPNLTLLELTGFLCGFSKDSDRILLSWNSKTFSYIDNLSNQNRWYMNMIWLSGTCLYQPISLNDTSTIYPYSLFSLLKCSWTYWRWWEFIFLIVTTHFSFTSQFTHISLHNQHSWTVLALSLQGLQLLSAQAST